MVLQDLLNSFKKLEGKENFPIYINNELLIGIDICSTGEKGLEIGDSPGIWITFFTNPEKRKEGYYYIGRVIDDTNKKIKHNE